MACMNDTAHQLITSIRMIFLQEQPKRFLYSSVSKLNIASNYDVVINAEPHPRRSSERLETNIPTIHNLLQSLPVILQSTKEEKTTILLPWHISAKDPARTLSEQAIFTQFIANIRPFLLSFYCRLNYRSLVFLPLMSLLSKLYRIGNELNMCFKRGWYICERPVRTSNHEQVGKARHRNSEIALRTSWFPMIFQRLTVSSFYCKSCIVTVNGIEPCCWMRISMLYGPQMQGTYQK